MFTFRVTSRRRCTAAAAPTPELMEAMHKLATREIAAGRMLDDGGLMPLDMGARITNARGRVEVVADNHLELGWETTAMSQVDSWLR